MKGYRKFSAHDQNCVTHPSFRYISIYYLLQQNLKQIHVEASMFTLQISVFCKVKMLKAQKLRV